MLHTIPEVVRQRMAELEAIDARDRQDGTPRPQRLRQIAPDTGRFLALLAAMTPPGEWIEIGTSAGYSTLWLALVARAMDGHITTYELLPEKAQLAQETFKLADVEDVVTLVQGDARNALVSDRDRRVAFCFLDAEKEVYTDCYEAVIPLLVPGGLLVADNAISHREVLQPMLDRALSDPLVDAVIVPIGTGLLMCRKG